ncbi:uncharacterized protein LOC143277768 [Babylonia areolata]|uniref:uncharacterized protein LOC143277768 n=1 Tax=Babylonia areolata TaxID=304850 RepID=UPI003FD2E507
MADIHKTGAAPPERQTQGKASGLTFLAENKAAVMEPHVRIVDNPRGYRHGGTPRPSAIRRLQNRKESEEAPNRKESDEAHNREESEEVHSRKESEEAHNREESGEAHNREESGEAHNRQESGEAHNREESEEAHSGEESGEAHNREESDEAHNREEESDEAHNSSASFNCRKNKDSIQKPHKTQTELDELRTGQDKGEVRHAESTLNSGKAAAVLTDKEVRKVTKTNGTFPQVRKTGHRSGGVLLVRETTNNLGYKRIGEVSTVRMPHPYRYAGTKSWDPVLMEAVLRWMSNGTKRNRLKRIRRQSPDGDELVVRTPVGKSSCKCETCSSNSAAYTTQQYENVAFNKKTITSSVYKDSYTQSLGGCGAVNGNTGHRWVPKSKPGANCFHTRDDDPAAWWTVDLMYVFTLRNMTLFRRGGQGGAANLAATLISIDYQTCYHFTLSKDEKRIVEQTRNLKEKLTVTCTRVVTGRVIRFEKISHVLTPLSKNLDVCELQIWVLHNVAIHKRVTLSSSDGTLGKLGTVITDGATTKTDSSGCVKTRSSSKKIVHWVEVQLVTTFRIIYATLRARLDCCSENELRQFYLVVTDEHSVSYPPNDKHVCQYHPKFITTRTSKRIDCKSPRDGRFFTIMKKDTHGLSVCEVQIYGHHRYGLSFGARCMSISETAVCAGGMVCSKGQCKMNVQEPCKRNEDCREGAVCDIRKCKYDINGRCQPNKNGCIPGAVCDPTSKTCKLSLNSQCSSGQCMTNTVCDALHFCKRKVGQQCDKSQECTAGAMCEEKKCVCDTHVSTQNGDQCDPVRGRIGSACQKPDDCKVVRSLCQNNVCVCKAEYSTFAENFSCKLKAGSSCSNANDCNTGLQCEDGKCRLTTGQRCADHQDLCVSGHRCSAGFCKIQLGEDCEDAKDQCVSGKCIAQDSYTCRLDAGQNCTSDRQQSLCRSGTVCEYGLVCKVTIGNPCSDTSTCQLGAVCGVRQGSSDKKCRKPAGSSDCSKDDDCVDTTVCDHQKNCRIAKSGDCQNRPGLCLTGSTCTGGTCQCNQEVTDPQSAKCDPRPRQVGGQCGSSGDTGECQDPGAMCGQDNTCHCDSTFAANHPDLHCQPISGRYGAPCDTEQDCQVDNSVCIDEVCVCQPGYRPGPDFTCEAESESAVKEGKGVLIGILAGVAAILVAVGMVIAFKSCQQRIEQELKKDDVKGDDHKNRLSELEDHVHGLESELYDDASTTTATNTEVSESDFQTDENAETELESSVAESQV